MSINSDDYTLVDFIDSDSHDIFAKAEAFGAFLDDWKSRGTYSYHRIITSASSGKATIWDSFTGHEREMIVMSSNNYLGLNNRPEVIEAARQALSKYGTGMCGSRFLSGNYDLIEELERQLAEFEHCEAAMVFTSGYQTNVGTISALMRPGDVVFIDRLSHASIVDGCKLSGCAFRTFQHNDMADLERLLESSKGKYKGRLLVSEGVFSMDGDMAPLPDIVRLAKKYEARVMVDEAHATGVLGASGRGSVEHFGLHGKVDVILGTFSKTFGATGGFIAGPKAVIDYVRHYGRSYMFSASPTPAVTATVLAGLDILRKEPKLREQLLSNVRYFYNGLKKAGFNVFPDPPESAIITVMVGPDTTVRAISKRIYEEGLFISSVAYPAVPRNEGKLRLSLSAVHIREELDISIEKLVRVGQEFGIAKEAISESQAYSAFAVK
ncbi:MAG: hypothetical protein A2283_02405 [Lentisphaerae bacterium RIFOXYA12_FULL_48_11]|nr:MAG: hypothetical protein A2283_02405 [Lentisphaerae bacterium RIFOXYA12_FULL_48_11]